MRRAWVSVLPLAAAAVTACGLVAGIQDVTVVDDTQADGDIPPFDATMDRADTSIILERDTGPDVEAGPDGGPHCDPTKAFGAPVAVTTLNTTDNDLSARLSPNELTVYLGSDRPGHLGGGSIYRATRTSITAAFGAPVLMTAINATNGAVNNPSVTADALMIFLQISGNGSTHIFLASRANVAVDFNMPGLLSNVNNSGSSDVLPFVVPDGSILYFASNRTGSYLLYQSVATDAVFAAATALAGTGTGNGSVADIAPVMSADLLTLYFASTRTKPSDSPYDLFVARRTTPTGAFATATLVTELNDPNASVSDVPSWLSPDGCRLYMSSDRANPGNSSDIYVATRTP